VNALLQAELLKLRTTRTFVALTALAVGSSVLIAGLVALLTEPTRDSVLFDVFASDTSSFLILVLAVIGISGEWRHRTITSSLLAAPERLRFLRAKTIAFAAAGLVLSVLTAVAVAAVGTLVLSVRDLPLPALSEMLAQAGRNAVLAALLGAFGVGIGALLRNQIAAVVSLLVLSFVVEPLVLALAPHVGRFGPLGALSISAAGIPAESAGLPEDVDLVGVLPAMLLLLLWIGVAFAVAAILLERRDLE
jgi:ABC-type transport system involved in multi-copper enzyme maturation permease subunit